MCNNRPMSASDHLSPEQFGEHCSNCYKPIDPKEGKIVYVNSYYDRHEQNPLCPTCSEGTPKNYITATRTPQNGKVETDIEWDH